MTTDSVPLYQPIVSLYFLSAILWALCWVPLGFGYHGSLWLQPAFKTTMQIWAWGHLVLGSALLSYGLKHKRPLRMNFCALCLSMLAFVMFQAWKSRYLS